MTRAHCTDATKRNQLRLAASKLKIMAGNGEGISDSRLGWERESGNPPFPDSAGKRESGPRLAANREIGDTLRCEYIEIARSWAGCCLKPFKCRFWPPPTFLLLLPRTGRWRMTTPSRTRRWRSMGRTFRTMSTQTLTPLAEAYQGTLESGIGSPVFPAFGGISRFPIPEWPGIGNRETGRFPFGREPEIGVPIRRAGDFLVWEEPCCPGAAGASGSCCCRVQVRRARPGASMRMTAGQFLEPSGKS